MSTFQRIGMVLLVMLAGTSVRAAAPERPLSERFSRANARPPDLALVALDSARSETPSFQRHVMPLLGRLGCNGRSCHGSFRGQGGFRLSMFGFDFEADHRALVTGD